MLYFFPNTFKGNIAQVPAVIDDTSCPWLCGSSRAITRKAMDNFHERLQDCVINNGRHLSDVIFKSI